MPQHTSPRQRNSMGRQMRVILIGAAGQLGTDLLQVLPADTLALDLPDFDVQCEDQVRAVLGNHPCELVINCAAQTNVDLCETKPAEALAINALGALHVARCADERGAAVIYVSTDYVFGAADSARREGYAEDDRPGPLNVYGASKLAGEQFTLAYNRNALVVRTCGLYGHAGARGKGGNFVETMLRLAAQPAPVRVVCDQRLSPTATAEAATKICQLAEQRARGRYHVAAQDSCTWFEFAQAIFAYAGLEVDLRPITSAEYPRPARRPAFSALSSRRLAELGIRPCCSWRKMLHGYLSMRFGATRPLDDAPNHSVPVAAQGAGSEDRTPAPGADVVPHA